MWKPKRAAPEDKFHVTVARFLNMALPPGSFWTTIPTVGSSLVQGAKLKAKGYRAGTPDVLIIYQSVPYWIELKAPKGVVSDEQRQVHWALVNAGSHTWLAKSLEHIQEALDQWGIPLRARLERRAIAQARGIA